MSAFQFACVFVGGGLGACLRWGLGLWTATWRFEFNYGVTIANLLGCLMIGILAGYFAVRAETSAETRLFLVTGLLGGFTTFSAFSLEAVSLLGARPLHALLYLAGNVGLCLLSTFGGLALVRLLPGSAGE